MRLMQAQSSPARRASSATTCCCARRATGRSSPSITARRASRRSSREHGLDARARRSAAICSNAADVQRAGAGDRRQADAVLYLAANGDPAASAERPRWDLESNTRRAGHVPRALPGRSRRLRVVGRGLRRAASATVTPATPVSPRLPYAISKLASEQYVAVLRGARGTRSKLRQRPLLRRLRPVRAGAQDHDAVAARAWRRPARVRRARRRREPDRLHVRGRCGRRVSGAGAARAATRGTVDFASGAPVSVNDVVQTMARALGVEVTVRHEGTPRSTSSSAPSITTMRERFGFVPTIVVRGRAARGCTRTSLRSRIAALASRPRSLTERALHEYVAEVEGHDSQVTGVVGYFYAMYRAEVLARVAGDRAAATSSKSAAAKG